MKLQCALGNGNSVSAADGLELRRHGAYQIAENMLAGRHGTVTANKGTENTVGMVSQHAMLARRYGESARNACTEAW